MEKDRQENRISLVTSEHDARVTVSRSGDQPVSKNGMDAKALEERPADKKEHEREKTEKNRSSDTEATRPKVAVLSSMDYRRSEKVAVEKNVSDKVSVIKKDEKTEPEPKVRIEKEDKNEKTVNSDHVSKETGSESSIYQGQVFVVPNRKRGDIKTGGTQKQQSGDPNGDSKAETPQTKSSVIKKDLSDRTKKILGSNTDVYTERKTEKGISDGKLSTGINSERSEAKTDGQKVTASAVKNTKKVSVLSKFRGGETQKVTTKKKNSKKVKVLGAITEIELPETEKKAKKILLFQKKQLPEKNAKKKKGLSPMRFFRGEETSGSSLLIFAAVIIISVLAYTFANAFTAILGTSLLEGYNIMTDEDSGYDAGYDKATYLLTKYGLSDGSAFQYDLWDSVLVGDSGFSNINSNEEMKHSVKTRILSVTGSCITDGAVENIFKDTGAASETKKNVIFWFGINDIKNGETAAGFKNDYISLIKEYIPESTLDFAGQPVYKTKYILSVLDTGVNDVARVEGQAEKVAEYNQALREMCAENSYFCYVDITPLADDDTYKKDGFTFSDSFYYMKLLPFLCSITDTDYHIGRDACGIVDDAYGIYGFTSDGTLLELLKFLYSYKNGMQSYNSFQGFEKMSREEFLSKDVQLEMEDIWDDVFNSENSTVYYEKAYADQQSFIIEEYYRQRLYPYIETHYSVNISGASYAFKSALISLGYHFAYENGEAFENKTVSQTFNTIFDSVDWAASEDVIISTIYDNAKSIDSSNAGRWDAEKADCLSMYEGTLDIYEVSKNEYGFINWKSHPGTDQEEPEDKINLAPKDSHGTGIIKVVVNTNGYIADHDETGGATAESYVAFALSFADAPELYGSGHYKLPYVWGGASLVTGADCSGFVGQILARYGYLDQGEANRHGYISGTFRDLGVGVDASDIRVGDIVCYQGHVAIYIGGGQIVHEPSANRSCGVEIGNVNVKTILAIRRFDN